MRKEKITFECDVKGCQNKPGCGNKFSKWMDKDEISGLFGPNPTNTAGTCPKCGMRMSFSIPSTTRAVNRALFGGR